MVVTGGGGPLKLWRGPAPNGRPSDFVILIISFLPKYLTIDMLRAASFGNLSGC